MDMDVDIGLEDFYLACSSCDEGFKILSTYSSDIQEDMSADDVEIRSAVPSRNGYSSLACNASTDVHITTLPASQDIQEEIAREDAVMPYNASTENRSEASRERGSEICSDGAFSADSDVEEGDPLPLEYARLYGIAHDHLEIPSLSYIDGLGHDIPDGLTNDSHLQQIIFPDYAIQEKLISIEKESATLLSWASNGDNPDTVENLLLPMLGSNEVKNMYLELPILKSDHQFDCNRFTYRDDFEVHLRDVKFPLEMVDNEQNEGVVFPSYLNSRGDEILEAMKKEKLVVSKDVIHIIASAIKLDWIEANNEVTWRIAHTYKRVCKYLDTYRLSGIDFLQVLEPVTPPLSPMLSHLTPNVPFSSDSAFEVPVTSDPPSLTHDDLQKIEKKIFDEDVPTPVRHARDKLCMVSLGKISGNNSKEDPVTQMLDALDASVNIPMISPRVKHQSLKVEETLTPQNLHPVSNPVNISEFVQEMRLATPGPLLSEGYTSNFFEEAFGEAAAKAMRSAEQELLIEADTTARVPIPTLSFEMPEAPWKCMQIPENRPQVLSLQKSFITDIVGFKPPIWPLQRLYRDDMRWNPFPHELAKVAVEEEVVEDNDGWDSIVFGPGADDIVSTSSLTWKPPGLKILSEEYDDGDEIGLGQFYKTDPRDVMFLTKKRKLEIDDQYRSGSRRSVSKAAQTYKDGTTVDEYALKVGSKDQELLESIVWTAETRLGVSQTGKSNIANLTVKATRLGPRDINEANREIEITGMEKKLVGEPKDIVRKRFLTSPNTRPLGNQMVSRKR
jgi:hypothetical protein